MDVMSPERSPARDGSNDGFVNTDRPSSSVNGGLSASSVAHGDVVQDGPATTTTITHNAGLDRASIILPEPAVASAVTDELPVVNSAHPQGESNPVLDPVEASAVTHELPVVNSPQPQGEPNPVFENVVVALDSRDDPRQEAAVPVEVVSAHKKQRHDEATEQLQEVEEPNEVDAVLCPICMEPWTSTGDHRICSLACGHLFGKSCIKRWLLQAGRKYSKCPHCNKRAKLEDVRTLFVPRVAVVDGERQQLVQEVQLLRAENHHLKLENTKLLRDVRQSKELIVLTPTAGSGDLENGFEVVQDRRNRGTHSRQPSQFRPDFNSRAHSSPYTASMDGLGGSFVLQNEVRVHGGKVFDMDADSQTLIFSNKIQGGCGNRFGLSKMSFLACTEIEKIDLPSDFGAVRDIRLSPSGIGGPGKLALVASAGKKLSVTSLESNNIVLTYSVQSPPWSCAWDPCVPNLLYSGLQTGSLLVLDLRQTSSPIAVLDGPSIRPIHSLQVVPDQSSGNQHSGSSSREILSASNTGIFRWNLGSSSAVASETIRPQCVLSIKEKVCVSLAYDGSIDTAVASFRRSPLPQIGPSSSLTPGPSSELNSRWPLDGPLMSGPSTAAINQEEPCHWIFKRAQQDNSCCGMNETSSSSLSEHPLQWRWVGAMVGHKSQSLFPRGAIISNWNSTPGSKSLFAGGDEGTNQVWLWDMESFRVTHTLVPHQSPVSDIKNVQIQGKDLMGCVSDTTFQLYQRRPCHTDS